jgi:hypothetical protein
LLDEAEASVCAKPFHSAIGDRDVSFQNLPAGCGSAARSNRDR